MNGFDVSEFTNMIEQLEQMGVDANVIAEHVLDAGSEPARMAFEKNVPRSNLDKEHAQDNVVISKSKKSKWGSKYRVIGATGGKTTNRVAMKRTRNYKGKVQSYTDTNADQFSYLYIVENGSVRAPAHPFVDKAYSEAQAAASEPMRQAFIQEFENHLR